ncbi:MAG: hypothetical protein ACF8GE_11815 [Phycisphaerales bacterium JB043]
MTRVLLGLIAGVLTAQSAHGGLIGLSLRWQTTSALTSGDDVHVFRMYARFTDPVTLLNVFEADLTSAIPFYQTGAPFGGDIVPSSGFFGFDSDLQWDTWVTAGDPDAADGTDTTTDPDFAMGSNTISGGWFDANPGTPDGQTDVNLEVLIMQVSFLVDDYVGIGSGGPMSGGLGVTYKDGAGSTIQETTNPLLGGFEFGPPPPAPGSGIAMLVGLGMASRRRR